jgi:hypothetical protein
MGVEEKTSAQNVNELVHGLERKKWLVGTLERLIRDVNILRTSLEPVEKKPEEGEKVTEQKDNVLDIELYKHRIERKERWIRHYLGEALRYGLDKDSTVTGSVIESKTHIVVREYIMGLCAQYYVGPYPQILQENPNSPISTQILKAYIKQTDAESAKPESSKAEHVSSTPTPMPALSIQPESSKQEPGKAASAAGT